MAFDFTPFAVDNSLSAAAPASGIGAMFSDPNKVALLMKIAGTLGSSLSNPGSPGDAMGKLATGMAQAGVLNRGMNPPAPAAPGTITPTAPTNSPGSEDYAKLAKLHKLAEETPPSFFTPTVRSTLGQAFAVDPTLMPNPTAPTGGNKAGTSVGNSFAQPSASAPYLSDAMAMTLDPTQVAAVHAHQLAVQKQINENLLAPLAREKTAAEVSNLGRLGAYYDAEARFKDWERSPDGMSFKLSMAGEPSRMAGEMEIKKQQFRQEEIERVIRDGNLDSSSPDFVRAAGFKSMGEMLRASSVDPQGVKSVADTLNSILDYQASLAATRAKYAEISESRSSREDSKAYMQLQKDDEALIKFKGMTMPSAFPNTPEGKKLLNNAQVMGKVMSPDDEKVYREIQARRRLAMAKLGIKFSDLPTTSSNEITVTPDQLRNYTDEGRRALDIERRKTMVDTFTDRNVPLDRNLFNLGGGAI